MPHLGERSHACLGGCVVALAGVGEHPRFARRVHDRRVHLVAGLAAVSPVAAGSPGGGEGAAQVDAYGHVPVVVGHVHHRLVAQDAGVVDQRMQVPERFDCGGDETFRTVRAGHVVSVGHRHPAGGHDLVDELLGRPCVVAASVGAAPQVVDDELRAVGGEEHGVLAADAPARTRDDHGAALQRFAHDSPSLPVRRSARGMRYHPMRVVCIAQSRPHGLNRLRMRSMAGCRPGLISG